MKKLVYAITLTAMMVLSACGDKGTIDQPQKPVTVHEFATDARQLEQTEIDLKAVGFRFTKKSTGFEWDESYMKRKWADRNFSAAINSKIVPALRNYQSLIRSYLSRYGTTFLVQNDDGTVEESMLKDGIRNGLISKDDTLEKTIRTLQQRRNDRPRNGHKR